MSSVESSQALYLRFLQWVEEDSADERRSVQRRLSGLFVWCFVAPAFVSLTLVMLMRAGMLPPRARSVVDWVILVFPLGYAVFFLGSEFWRGLRDALKRGGIGSVLGQIEREAALRSSAIIRLERFMGDASGAQWRWVRSSFAADLESLLFRTRFVTVLAGSVLFLIMQGIDAIAPDSPTPVEYIRHPWLGWLATRPGNDLAAGLGPLIGLGLFLVLLYLSGLQTHQALKRYQRYLELAGPAQHESS